MKRLLGVLLLAGCTPINSDALANGLTGIARDAVDKAMSQPSQRTQPTAQAVPAAAQQPAPRKLQLKGKLAVLELRNFAKDLKRENAQYFTDVVRQTSLRVQPEVDVMTRENLLVLLESSGKKLDECEGECEVDTGRRIGADEVVSGEIQKLGSLYKMSLRLHDTREGKLLSSAIASGKSVEELDLSVQKAAEDLLSGR